MTLNLFHVHMIRSAHDNKRIATRVPLDCARCVCLFRYLGFRVYFYQCLSLEPQATLLATNWIGVMPAYARRPWGAHWQIPTILERHLDFGPDLQFLFTGKA